jgi:hypothetical protein
MRFKDIESKSEPTGRESALDSWYNSVRTKPIIDFSIDDLCRACRQELYLEHVVPVALSAIEKDITAGYQYDGELASVLMRIPAEFWNSQIKLAKSVAKSLREGLEEFDDDVREEVMIFLSRITD